MHLFDAHTLLAYLAAAVVLVIIPGPGTAWIVAQTVAGGTARGLRAGLGLETATLIHALAAGFGLSAVLATSALAFEVLKYAGAFYLVWLGINLITAFLAGLVVQRFEGTIEKVAALAALMPIVASMGGIAGTQTVTLIIRGLALGQIEWGNARWLLFKEIAVGGLNGGVEAHVVLVAGHCVADPVGGICPIARGTAIPDHVHLGVDGRDANACQSQGPTTKTECQLA